MNYQVNIRGRDGKRGEFVIQTRRDMPDALAAVTQVMADWNILANGLLRVHVEPVDKAVLGHAKDGE